MISKFEVSVSSSVQARFSGSLLFRSSLFCSLLLVSLLLPSPARAQMPLDPVPSWESASNGHVATGGGWADVDGDGWVDLVAANGNDINRQRVVIYHNNGDGTFPANPTWNSSDIDFHGHLDIGDIDGDELPDVAVAVYLGPSGFGSRGTVKVYLNDGVGGFRVVPDWIAAVDFYCFSVALGDADGDGDLDLACASGESYTGVAEKKKVFFNHGGVLESTPSWESDESGYALDVQWSDVDQDGDLDLVYCGIDTPMRIYRNDQTSGGSLSTSATWENTDMPQYGNTTAAGDWDGDGFPEIAVADNDQLGGPGRFKVYGNSDGAVSTSPTWNSATGGYGSHVSWIDLDSDGDADLATGRWWGSVGLYENVGGNLSANPVWTSSTSSVIENMFWEDVDNLGLDPGALHSEGDGTRTVFELGASPVRSVDDVRVGGISIDASSYCEHLGRGWISISPPPPTGVIVEVDYTLPTNLDLGVTNWDSGVGNYLFLSSREVAGLSNPLGLAVEFAAYPNPIRARTQFRLGSGFATAGELSIYDSSGRRVKLLHRGGLSNGLQVWDWDRTNDRGGRVGSGVYFARFRSLDPSSSRMERRAKLVLID